MRPDEKSCGCAPACRAFFREYLLRSVPGTEVVERHEAAHSFSLLDAHGRSLCQLLVTPRLTATNDVARLERILGELDVAGHLLAGGPETIRLDGMGDILFLKKADGSVLARTQMR